MPRPSPACQFGDLRIRVNVALSGQTGRSNRPAVNARNRTVKRFGTHNCSQMANLDRKEGFRVQEQGLRSRGTQRKGVAEARVGSMKPVATAWRQGWGSWSARRKKKQGCRQTKWHVHVGQCVDVKTASRPEGLPAAG
ncbi:MAG: hypothetical protein CMN76_10360 [Spirochaetaceae bacterium]|nr:hypothetical protein [Spirochaetaceae bacterium]